MQMKMVNLYTLYETLSLLSDAGNDFIIRSVKCLMVQLSTSMASKYGQKSVYILIFEIHFLI